MPALQPDRDMDPASPTNGTQSTALPVPDFRVLFESAPIPFLVVLPDDPSFTIVAANQAYLRALKKSREDLVGRSVFEAIPTGPDAANAATARNVLASFHRVLATRQPDSMPVQKYDLPRPNSEGSLRLPSLRAPAKRISAPMLRYRSIRPGV